MPLCRGRRSFFLPGLRTQLRRSDVHAVFAGHRQRDGCPRECSHCHRRQGCRRDHRAPVGRSRPAERSHQLPALCGKLVLQAAPKGRRNAFQNLGDGSALWYGVSGKHYVDYLTPAEVSTLTRLFQQRHLLAHTGGIVDQDYIARSGDTSTRLARESLSEIAPYASFLTSCGSWPTACQKTVHRTMVVRATRCALSTPALRQSFGGTRYRSEAAPVARILQPIPWQSRPESRDS
jgi:hypothetical protein